MTVGLIAVLIAAIDVSLVILQRSSRRVLDAMAVGSIIGVAMGRAGGSTALLMVDLCGMRPDRRSSFSLWAPWFMAAFGLTTIFAALGIAMLQKSQP